MHRSLGFGSFPNNFLFALFRLAFATPSTSVLSYHYWQKLAGPWCKRYTLILFPYEKKKKTWIVLSAFRFRFFSLPSLGSRFTFPSQYFSLSVFLSFFFSASWRRKSPIFLPFHGQYSFISSSRLFSSYRTLTFFGYSSQRIQNSFLEHYVQSLS